MTSTLKLKLTFSQAIDGFVYDKETAGLSPHTLADYGNAFSKFKAYLDGDPLLNEITADQVREFLHDLGTKPQPRGGIVKQPPKPLSKKSILNIHTALSSLWTWAEREGYVDHHIIRDVPRTKPEKRVINPFTEADVRAMLEVCDRSISYARPGKRRCDHGRPTALRDRVIILILLDTGMRASELCELTIKEVDHKNRKILAFGKWSKERVLRFSTRTAKAVWQYLTTRPDASLGDRFIVTSDGRDYNRQALLQLINGIGKRAGVPDAHPHRYRHTFAINYLRNGGDPYTLQALLGHETMETVQIYLQIAQADLDSTHDRASPVENWSL